MSPLYRFWAAALLLLTALPAAGRGRVVALPAGAVEGRLSNGLRYVLLRNALPRHTVECRLVMSVGSIDERDDERGAAHFLEHMAFGGSARFPGGAMVDFFERQGMKYGRDINAVTSFDRTIYWLSLPVETDRDPIVDSAFVAMADIVRRLTLDSAATRRERGVILEELRGYRQGDDFYALKNGHGAYAEHLPLGGEDDIAQMETATLRRFYTRCYTPGRATVVVVGDIDARDAERRLRGAMTSLPKGPSRPAPPPKSYAPGVSLMALHDGYTRHPRVEIIIPHASVARRTIGDHIAARRDNILRAILDNRLSAIGVSVFDDWYLADKAHTTFAFDADSPPQALGKITAIAATLKELAANGCADGELEWAAERQALRVTAGMGEKMSAEWCEDFTDRAIVGDHHLADERDAEQVRHGLRRTTGREMRALARRRIADAEAHTLCAVSLPEAVAADLLTPEAVEEAWRRATPDSAPPFVRPHGTADKEPDATLPDVLARAHPDIGAIADKRYYHELALGETTLRNGIRLLLRPTKTREGLVHVTAMGRGGLADLPDTLYNSMKDAVAYVDMGGLEAVSGDTLSNAMYANGLMLNVGMGNRWFEALATGPTDKTQAVLNLLYEKMCRPGRDTAGFREAVRHERENMGRETRLSLMLRDDQRRQIDFALDSIFGNAAMGQYSPLTAADFDRMSLDAMTGFYKSAFADPGRLSILITGDFDPRQMEAMAANTFGRMPPPAQPPALRGGRARLPAADIEKRFAHDDSTQTSCNLILSANYKPQLRNTLMFKLMRDILQDRLLRTLRHGLSIAYSPFVGVSYNGEPQQVAWLRIEADVKNDNFGLLRTEIDSVVSSLATTPIAASDLEKMKRSFVVTKRQALSDVAPAEWRSAIAGLIRNGETLADFDQYERVLQSISPADIRDEFARFARNPRVLLYQRQ